MTWLREDRGIGRVRERVVERVMKRDGWSVHERVWILFGEHLRLGVLALLEV